MVQATGSPGGVRTQAWDVAGSFLVVLQPFNITSTENISAVHFKTVLGKISTPNHDRPDNQGKNQAKHDGR